MDPNLVIRPMTRSEATHLVDWAAAEGWNPGLHDAEVFWHTDPDAFIAAELEGELVGGGTITAYQRAFGFMGFFIVHPAFRGRGLGDALWRARRDRLLVRLDQGASIGMDGVFDMQRYYARGGFAFSHRDIRFRAEVPANASTPAADPGIVPLGQVPFDEVLAYDRTCFPADRARFLRAWIDQPDARALGLVRAGKLAGYGSCGVAGRAARSVPCSPTMPRPRRRCTRNWPASPRVDRCSWTCRNAIWMRSPWHDSTTCGKSSAARACTWARRRISCSLACSVSRPLSLGDRLTAAQADGRMPARG